MRTDILHPSSVEMEAGRNSTFMYAHPTLAFPASGQAPDEILFWIQEEKPTRNFETVWLTHRGRADIADQNVWQLNKTRRKKSCHSSPLAFSRSVWKEQETPTFKATTLPLYSQLVSTLKPSVVRWEESEFKFQFMPIHKNLVKHQQLSRSQVIHLLQ